jgi:hypothetical protein
MIAPTYRSVCQFTGERAGPVALPDLPLPRGPRVSSAPAPCGLPRHAPGRRVMFTQWDKARGAMETITGKVITHVDRTAWMGWRACQVNTRQHGLVVTSDRDVAANDEAGVGEVR